jgi:predicted lipoprotein with Yx(FWY)xxD motif
MFARSLLIGATALLALSALPAFADSLAGGAVQTMKATDGSNYFADAKGMTLYTYDNDNPGKSACYDKCATAWPPLMAPTGATPSGDFTIVDRKDGSKMWAYNGMPLYTWVKDKKPGDITGDNVGKVWHTAKPAM